MSTRTQRCPWKVVLSGLVATSWLAGAPGSALAQATSPGAGPVVVIETAKGTIEF